MYFVSVNRVRDKKGKYCLLRWNHVIIFTNKQKGQLWCTDHHQAGKEFTIHMDHRGIYTKSLKIDDIVVYGFWEPKHYANPNTFSDALVTV